MMAFGAGALLFASALELFGTGLSHQETTGQEHESSLAPEVLCCAPSFIPLPLWSLLHRQRPHLCHDFLGSLRGGPL